MAVPFVLLAVVVLAFLAGPVKREPKDESVRTQVQPDAGGAPEANPSAP